MNEFDELKRLAEAATPGPWEYQKDSKDFPVNGYVTVRDCIYSVCVLPYEGIRADDRVTDNGRFIAAANPAAILTLIARVEAAEAELERLRSQEPVAYMDSRYGLCWYKDRKPSPETMLYTEPKPPTHPGATHCENCGCTWLDDGLNPVGCPYCKKKQELTA